MSENGRWDVVVVGGGAAGLAAALTLSRARRRVLVVDEGRPRNAPAAGVHNYLGREGTPPAELVAIGRAEAQRYGATVRSGRVVAASRTPDGGFALDLDDGTRAACRQVVVATGAVDELPEVDGLAGRWGRDVLHCPYCHGWEVRDRRIGVLGTNALSVHQAQLLRQWSDDVVLLVHGASLRHEDHAELRARGIEVVPGPVAGLEVVDDVLRGVRLADGRVVALDALAVTPRVRARAEVPAMLGVGTVEVAVGPPDAAVVAGDVVEADPAGRTAVPGLWVAGNVADVRAVVVGAAAAGTAVAAAVNADLVADDVRQAVAALPEPGSPEFWEGFYRDRPQVWSGRPNPQLVDAVAALDPGTALDLGAGEGGDVLWLAGRGWKVLAVDVSDTALERIAERAGDLPVTGERHDLTQSFPDGTFDLVSAQFLHSPSDAFPRAEILRRAAAAVAPGGTLLVVGHGRLPSWAWHPATQMPTAEGVLTDLALDPAAWEVVRCASPERPATGPDGQSATITDEIVQVRRRHAGRSGLDPLLGRPGAPADR